MFSAFLWRTQRVQYESQLRNGGGSAKERVLPNMPTGPGSKKRGGGMMNAIISKCASGRGDPPRIHSTCGAFSKHSQSVVKLSGGNIHNFMQRTLSLGSEPRLSRPIKLKGEKKRGERGERERGREDEQSRNSNKNSTPFGKKDVDSFTSAKLWKQTKRGEEPTESVS